MIEKPSWRRWYWNLSLEDNKALMLCPLILLSLPGNVPIIWLDSVRPFGYIVAEKERKDSLGNGDKVQEQSGKCTVCSEAQELLVWLEYLEHGSPGKGEGEEMTGVWAKKAPKWIKICLEKGFSSECVMKVG